MIRVVIWIFSFNFLFASWWWFGPKYDYSIHKPKVIYPKPSREALSKLLRKQLGKPYVWAEEGPNAFDCSGLVYYCFSSMNMKHVPRVSRNQAKVGKAVPLDQLQYGDLIFFDTTPRKTGQITHVGIYIGDGKFEHASNEKEGVKISSLNSPYYSSRIRICRRWLPDENSAGSDDFLPFDPISIAESDLDCSECYQVPKRVTAKRGRWFIQVGSFQGSPDPKWLAHITALGYTYRSKLGADGMSRLYVGPFISRKDAQAVLPNAQHEFNPKAFIKELDDEDNPDISSDLF